MWRSVTSRNYVSLISICREFHSGLAHSNWMLSNDIVRNALTSKSIAGSKPVEAVGSNSGGTQDRGTIKKNKNRSVGKSKTHGRKNLIITWSSGSDRDKEAANAVLSQIFRMNRAGTIKFVNPVTSKLEETNIRSFAKGINLEESGLTIVNFEEVDEMTKIPLVKLVDRMTALKKFSDERARQKEQEMIRLGLIKRKPAKYGDGEKAEDNVKQIKLSWQIKNDDLKKQKAHEITNQLKKGYKVHLYIDDKNRINSKNWAADFDSLPQNRASKHLTAKELDQRTSILDRLTEIVNDFSGQSAIEGSVETRMLLKLTPKSVTVETSSRQSLKEQRKRERQEKLQQRILKKKQRNLEREPEN